MWTSDAERRLPSSLQLKKLSFGNRWYGTLCNLREIDRRTFVFGYLYEGGEAQESWVASAIEEQTIFSLEPGSTLWRVSEIRVERTNEWLVFSRRQGDLSAEALYDFLIDSRNYLEHLRGEDKRLNPESKA
jgi:hypothetical protein